MAVRVRGSTFQADVTVKGQRVRRDGFTTRSEAEAWEADVKAKLLRGEPLEQVAPKPCDECRTLGQLLEKVYQHHWLGKKSCKFLYSNGKDVVKVLGENTPLQSISTRSVDTLKAKLLERKVCGSTINRKLAALSKMIGWARERNYMTQTPVIGRAKESEPRMRVVSSNEEAEILRWCREVEQDEDFRDLIIVLLDTGLRLSEAIHLEWYDVREGFVRVWGSATPSDSGGQKGSKSGRNKAVPQTDRVAEVFDLRKQAACREGPVSERGRVFPKRLTKARAEVLWVKMRKWIGLTDDPGFVLHSLRHTFCTRLARAKVPIQVIQKLAGHQDLKMTLRYAHTGDAELAEAIQELQGKKLESVSVSTTATSHACDVVQKCDGAGQNAAVA